jgi:hypothetical protein
MPVLPMPTQLSQPDQASGTARPTQAQPSLASQATCTAMGVRPTFWTAVALLWHEHNACLSPGWATNPLQPGTSPRLGGGGQELHLGLVTKVYCLAAPAKQKHTLAVDLCKEAGRMAKHARATRQRDTVRAKAARRVPPPPAAAGARPAPLGA